MSATSRVSTSTRLFYYEVHLPRLSPPKPTMGDHEPWTSGRKPSQLLALLLGPDATGTNAEAGAVYTSGLT